MKHWTPQQVAEAAGARLTESAPNPGELERAVVDSRQAGPGTLFVGLRGQNVDGGRFAAAALAAGAWGVLVAPEHAEGVTGKGHGTVLAASDPLRALQSLASAWRRELGAQVI